MKRWHWIVIATVLVPLLIAAGLYWYGGRTQVYRASIEIEAPPEEVFPYLIEPERITQWVHGVEKMTPLTEGGHRVGARALVIVEEEGTRYEFTDEVIQSIPAQTVAVQSESEIFDAHNRWELEPAQEGTHLEVTMRANFHGLFRFFAPMMRSQAESRLQADFETLRQLIESNTEVPAPNLESPTEPIDPTPTEPPSPVPLEPEETKTDNWMMT